MIPFVAGDYPGWLWSLWDMLKFRASDFHRAAGTIQSIRGHLEGVMAVAVNTQDDSMRLDPVGADTRALIVRRLTRLENVSAGLSIPVTMDAVRFLKKHIDVEKRPISYEELRNKLSDIHDRMVSELKSVMMLILEPEMTRFYEPSEPIFGTEVETKFPSALYEIDEAGKCHALDRSTATVFHLMRVMEIGIRAIARSLQIADPLKPVERNWGNILGKIKEGINARWPTATDRASGDGALFESLYASLDAVRNPWRNATMHVEAKYTPEEAKHVLDAVGGFMRKLASRLDEQGQPFV